MATSERSQSAYSNGILARLSSCDSFTERLQPIELPLRFSIYQPNEPIRYAYFPEAGMISIVSVMENGDSIEVGTVCCDGVVGASAVLGAEHLPYQCYVQLPGHGYRIEVALLKAEADRNPELLNLILRNESAGHIQSMQCAACNGLHNITQRCCRWLLMSRDCTQSDSIPLTQEFLALMLGVRRPSVTDVLRPLQEKGWIHSNRGEITVVDRKGLESGSCECYRVIRTQQKYLLA